jgi:hypothetical protein
MSPFTRSRLIPVLTAALTAVMLTPAAASGKKSSFGSSLDHTPANAGSTCSQDGVGQPGDLCTHVGSDYPGFSGHAKSPASGTIFQLKIRPMGPLTFVPEVVSVRNVASNFMSGQAKATAKGHKIHLAGPTQSQMANSDYPIDKVIVNLKVSKGQEIAINTTSNTAEYCSDGTPGQLLFDPVLSVGSPFAHSDGVDGCLMLVQAEVRS